MSERLRALRNVMMSSATSVVESMIGLAIGVVIARTLGPTEYGHYAFVIFLCGWLVSACNHALTTSSIKFIAEARGSGEERLASAISARLQRLQVASCLVVLTAFAGFVTWNPPDEWAGSATLMLLLSVVAVWARAGFWMLGAIGQGYERFDAINVGVVVAALVQSVIALALASAGAGMVAFVASFASSGIVMNLTVRAMLRRYDIRPRTGEIPRVVLERMNRHLMLTGVLVVLSLGSNRAVETLVLKAYATPEALGFLAIAASLTKGAVDLLSNGMSTILLPAMSRAYGQADGRQLSRVVEESIRYYWFLGLLTAGVGAVAAEGAVRVLYGAEFVDAGRATAALLVVAGLSSWQAAINALQVSTDQQGVRVRITVATLTVNILLAWLLVPEWGLAGALASIAATRAFSVWLSWMLARRSVHFSMPGAAMGRLALAAGVAAALAFALDAGSDSAWMFVPCGMAFFVAFAFASLILRTWTPEDFEMGTQVLRRIGLGRPRLLDALARLRTRFADGGRG